MPSSSPYLCSRFGDDRLACCAVIAAMLTLTGCQTAQKMIAPSQNRDWQPLYSVLPTAKFVGEQVAISNVRYCKYIDADSYVPDWYNEQVDLRSIRGVDYVVMPFPDVPALAHTQLSFEFKKPGEPPKYIAVSAEVRKEKGETYGALKGSARQFEMTYVVADERDIIRSQTNFKDRDVYIYRSTATPEQARRLFVDVMGRVNQLAARPEFYDTLTNNCTTAIVEHINRIHPQRLAYDYRVLLPGLSDKLAYDQGLIEHRGSFAETKAQAYVSQKAKSLIASDDFSQLIRR